MYGRLTRLQTPTDSIDKGIAYFKQTVAPNARSQPGNAGAVLLVDRKTGTAVGITLWETAQALLASEQFGTTSRAGSSAAVAGASILNVMRFEQVIADRAKPPASGTYVRMNSLAGKPENIERALTEIRERVLPVVKGLKGYRALLVNIDRTTGAIGVASSWDSMADLEASDEKVRDLRSVVAEAAGAATPAMVEVFETVFADIKTPATV